MSRPRTARPPLPRLPRGRSRGGTGRGRRGPPVRWTVTEVPRAALDLAALTTLAPALAVDRRGDGHPVLVVPGLVGGDVSTLGLRRYLTWLGYRVSDSGIRVNGGTTAALVGTLRARLERLAADAGRPVSIVGWSLGGLYAHELARRTPGVVRQVITLGSPVGLSRSRGRSASRLHDRLAHVHLVPALVPRPWAEAGTLRVPATSVYTRGDGIVSWQACLLRSAARRQNVEVHGSHLGLVVNPTVLHVLADRLAQPEGTWRPFRPGPLTRHLYP